MPSRAKESKDRASRAAARGRDRKASKRAAGSFAYEGLDRVLHEKARLGILAALLARADGIVFPELKQLCALTDGNLSRHLQVLHEAGLVDVFKGFANKRPQTLVRLSRPGRVAFLEYVEELERVVRDAKAEAARSRDVEPMELPAGWMPA